MLDLDFIEGCYAASDDDDSWGCGIAQSLAPLVPNAASVMASAYHVSARRGLSYGDIGGDARYMDSDAQRAGTLLRMDHVNRSRDRAAKLSAFTSARPCVVAISELPNALQKPLRQTLFWPGGDILGIFGTLDGEHGFVLGPSGPDLLAPSPRQRLHFERWSEHLAIGYWLRRERARATVPQEENADAVFSPDGQLLHYGKRSKPAFASLVDSVRRMDRARCRRQKRSPEEATELWQGLIQGEYTLIESFERGGRRLVLAVRCRSPRPTLTPRELAVARAAASGLGNKLIGDSLGIAPPTVAVHLRSALRKLRCPNRRALAHWFRAKHGSCGLR